MSKKRLSVNTNNSSEYLGLLAGSSMSGQNYADNVVFAAERGHGFAAERANHLHDKLTLQKSVLVGGDNAKNGADRLVDNIEIQTKYCSSGSKCVGECFDESGWRYWNGQGQPMQIEVPSDLYDDAVKALANRIRKGQIPGVTNPEQAKEIIRKGHYTYAQAHLIAKAGTIESLTYDAKNGVKLAAYAGGLSAAVSFAVALWNGESFEDALVSACESGLRVGGVAWIGSVLTAQLGRTSLEQSLRGTTDWMVQQMGAKAASWVAAASGKTLYGAAATKHASKLLRGNYVAAAVTTVVLSSVDLYRMFDGRISGAQLFKNVSATTASVAGGVGGGQAGATYGFVVGGPVGAVIGGVLGGLLGGWAAQGASKAVLDEFIEDDAKEMSRILESVFVTQAQLFLLNKTEAEQVLYDINAQNLPDCLRDMYGASNREEFAQNLLTPLIEKVVGLRKKVTLPSSGQLLKGLELFFDRVPRTV